MTTPTLNDDDPITIVTLRAGNKYGPEYVERLQAAVKRNLTLPHRFVCLTDQPQAVNCETLPIPLNLPSWWGKVALFSDVIPGRKLFFDLDTVIIGNIDDFARYTGDLAVIRPFYREDGIASGLIGIGTSKNHHVWDLFSRDPEAMIRYCHQNANPPWNNGDQRWLELTVKDVDYWQNLLPGQLVSYKVHCQNTIPEGARIVCFHDKPDPHEVQDSWIHQNWI